LYVGHWNGLGDAMSVINNPDVKGAGCAFCPLCSKFPKYGSTNPPCMPNYRLGAAPVGGSCWAVGVDDLAKNQEEIKKFPNPAHDIFYIQTKPKEQKELYNSLGQLLLVTFSNEINVSGFVRGLYYVKAGNEIRKLIIE
jgi:hypothetical protein